MAQTLWFVSFVSFFYGCIQLKPFWITLRESFGVGKKILQFQKASVSVFQLQELLSSGLVPEPSDWNRLRSLPEPWDQISSQSVVELRDQGAPVLPTLKRIRSALEEQVELMQESQTKSAQGWSQAVLGVVMVPLFTAVLYFLLPEVQESPRVYFGAALFSFFLTAIAVIWMGLMIDQARFGGVKRDHQSWYGSAIAGMERLWAFIQTGLPPDLAWKTMIEELSKTDPSLAQSWGPSIWNQEILPHSLIGQNEFERLLIQVGQELKKSIQISLVEGRGCLERMDAIHRSFLTEYRLKLIRRLNLLPNQCLKPLFIFVFPSIFILLFTGITLSVNGLLP